VKKNAQRAAALVVPAVLLLGVTACTSSGNTPSGHPSSASAAPSGSARKGGTPADPHTYGQPIPGAKTLLETRGKGDSSLPLRGQGKSGDLVISLSCTGKGPLKVTDKAGRLLLGIAGCKGTQGAIYSSRAALRQADATLEVTTGPAVDWRVTVLRAPHADS
jgi:hypothetical protein